MLENDRFSIRVVETETIKSADKDTETSAPPNIITPIMINTEIPKNVIVPAIDLELPNIL